MPKFQVLYTLADRRMIEIEAKDREDAEDKLNGMFNNGDDRIYKGELLETEMVNVDVQPL